MPLGADVRAARLGIRSRGALALAFGLVAPAAVSPLSAVADPIVAGAGDIACASSIAKTSGCRQKATSDLLVSLNPSAVLPLGDNQYDVGALSAYKAYYDPSWGRVKSVTKPVPGNHEYATSGAAGYFSYFGSRAGPSGKGYYSYNVGAWHLIAINSSVGVSSTSAQYQWLASDLAASTAKCTLAYWHKPRFSVGSYSDLASMGPIFSLLYNKGADVVLSGHDHNYQRWAPVNPSKAVDTVKGIRQFVVGTGGKSHYAIDSSSGAVQKTNGTTFGVLKLTLHAGSYDFKFVPISGSTFTDSGTSSCH